MTSSPSETTAIIIGAGRGARLMPLTEDTPKCYAEIQGKSILDWIQEAFREAGIERIVFIGGYQIERIRSDYPEFIYYQNSDWENNNILLSLFYAQAEMARPFVCSYADILFKGSVVKRAIETQHDITIVADTDWRSRYTGRTQHPEDDAEKIRADGETVNLIHRDIPSEEADGEYIGVTHFSAEGARQLKEHFHRARTEHDGGPYREAGSFQKAYLIHLYQDMIEHGVPFHKVDTHGDYMEIDTTEDYHLAEREWR